MYRYIKRIIDFVLSLFGIVSLIPIYLVLIVVIRFKLGSPIFFIQERSTLNGRSFSLLKFRTMTNKTDSDGNLLPDELRKTSFGSWLRNTSLDELPELLNILKGDMAIIGPRPIPSKYNIYFSDYEKKRFKVRGGLLPPEVLKDNPTPTWNEQLQWEAEYGEDCSFFIDLKILFRTFRLLIHRKNDNYGEYVRKSLSEERTEKNNAYESSNTSA